MSARSGVNSFAYHYEKAPGITGGRKEAISRSLKKRGTALASKGRTQNVRSDAEKAPDPKYER